MTLHFAILSFDRYSRDSLIGEVFFALNEKDVLESIEKEQVSIQKDIVLRSVKVYSTYYMPLIMFLKLYKYTNINLNQKFLNIFSLTAYFRKKTV